MKGKLFSGLMLAWRVLPLLGTSLSLSLITSRSPCGRSSDPEVLSAVASVSSSASIEPLLSCRASPMAALEPVIADLE